MLTTLPLTDNSTVENINVVTSERKAVSPPDACTLPKETGSKNWIERFEVECEKQSKYGKIRIFFLVIAHESQKIIKAIWKRCVRVEFVDEISVFTNNIISKEAFKNKFKKM